MTSARSWRPLGASALAFALGLAFAPAVLAADLQASPSATPLQQSAQPPASQPILRPGVYGNPNQTPPWAVNRNGAGEVTDPVYGVPAPGYGENGG